MGRNRNKHYGKTLPDQRIETAGAEGMCISRYDGKVVFVRHAVPGDIADLKIIGRKKKFLIGEITDLKEPSEDRVEPFCPHFGICGGCKWQQMSYPAQLKYKQQQVKDAFDRIGKLDYEEIKPILGSDETRYYRNKLEFTFSNKRWLTADEMSEENLNMNAVGFHVPGRFDKVLDIKTCFLQEDLSNRIRNEIRDFAQKNDLSFFDLRNQGGLLRNLIIRNSTLGQWMVIVSFYENDEAAIQSVLEHLAKQFPEITSLMYVVNSKANDTLYDQEIKLFKGEDHIIEQLKDLKFRIRPKSFFQTNTKQAEALYDQALNMAGLTGDQVVYDLYCGTGTISLFVARNAKKVVGIESVDQAVADANDNAALNGIENCSFVCGDMKDLFNDEFIAEHGKADVIITDPPRAGMHPKVVEQLCQSGVQRIVYVSCNPATQARDLDLMRDHYNIEQIQPVDMFPHTHHVENVVLLTKKETSKG